MTKAEFLAILEKHLDGTATAAERRVLDNFYQHHLARSKKEWMFTESERIRLEIFESLNRAIDADVRQQRRPVFNKTLRIAATVIIILTAGIGLYLTRFAAPEIQYTTITTPRGQQKTITLSDGSVVHLNAESSITFPEQFAALDSRNIQFSGEAFFEVTPDKTKPFIIHSEGLITTVVGTSFNVQAYPEDETIAVTVATGKVRIEVVDDQQRETASELLNPGQQGLYDKRSARIARTQVQMEKYFAWKDGTILLQGATLKEATDILGRWYDAEFIFENPDLKTCTIDGKFRNDQLPNILENLRFLMGIEYRIEEGNKVIINGKSCH